MFNDLGVIYRFFSKSGGANLVQTALNLKSEYSGTEQDLHASAHGQAPTGVLGPTHGACSPLANGAPFALLTGSKVGAYRLPPRPSPLKLSGARLIDHLVVLFFSRINLFIPLLRRLTFERDLRDNLHFRDQALESVLLCVCVCVALFG